MANFRATVDIEEMPFEMVCESARLLKSPISAAQNFRSRAQLF